MRRRIYTGLGAFALVAALAACSSGQPEPDELDGPQVTITAGPASSSEGDSGSSDSGSDASGADGLDLPDGIDRAEYEAKVELAREVAKVMSTWTPGEDLNWTASELRAREFMTAAKADEVLAPERPASGDQWRLADEKGATSIPFVSQNTDFDLPAQTHEDKQALVISMNVYWSWQTPDLEAWAGRSRTYYFSFTDEEPYKIAGYTYEDG
ncbi:hypothetical protein GCG21_08555 [Pseudactinotalea sp. HY160]|uniref:hypothetical protein n=1 Tax=Pseudactinotalea sp. HY160 TaxID=2654490 RepID=UPI00128DDDF5|nr:hypothetical protein [Pseudactinotalea sp. HY160]MPV50054.1 hypothetical protein [Pseudactinotalea sp. HY160]